MSGHTATVAWTCDGDFRSGHYSRVHELRFDGGAAVRGSASPAIVPPPLTDPAGVDPEEALIASAAACHMLWFLDLARRDGWSVLSYRDEASGTLGKDDRGRLAITGIVLDPVIEFALPAPTAEQIDALHHRAHDACFIANTLRCDVILRPR